MNKKQTNEFPKWNEIHTIIFDFDGVFTDNKVFVSPNGDEIVRCDRRDGLAFDILRSFIKAKKWKIDYFIVSKERNPIVLTRAAKMKIPCHHGVDDKLKFIKTYLSGEGKNPIKSRTGLIYLGNDLNDLAAMEYAGFSVAPKDAHPIIRKISSAIIYSQSEGSSRL